MRNVAAVRSELPLVVADLFEAAGSMRRHGDRLAGTVGQTQARWQLLSVASVGDWTVPHIARRLGVSRQAVQRVADELRAEGLVENATNPNHRRSPLIRLTASGRDALEAISAAADTWHREQARALDLEDLAAARRVLRSLADVS